MDSTCDTRTLAAEWLARIATPAPGYRNELTAARLAGALGTTRFDDIVILSITHPHLDPEQVAAHTDLMEGTRLPDWTTREGLDGTLTTLRDMNAAHPIGDPRPDRERALRARFELDQLTVSRPDLKPAADRLNLLLAWLTGDRTGIDRYRTARGTAGVLVGAAFHMAELDRQARRAEQAEQARRMRERLVIPQLPPMRA